MKKFLSIILSILICCCAFSFVGCDNSSGNVDDNGGGDPSSPTEYTVKFDLNGGSGSVADQVVGEGGKVIKPASPTRDGYDFDGWFTAAVGGKIWNFYLDTVTNTTTLYAHWTVQIVASEGLSYRAIEEGGNTVAYAVKGIGNATGTALVVPSEFDGLPVTRIDDYAFYECNSIASVTIGGNVSVIGDSAFYNCEKLESLVIDAEISKMGDLAFAHCLKLESVQIGQAVEEISYYAFFECSALKEIYIPASVKSIGESAFSMCSALEEVTLNDGIEYIGDCAFGGCVSLKEFIMPDSVTEIGFGVLMFVGGYLYDGDMYYGANSVRKIVMSDNITEITQFAFSGCQISTIAIGNKVETIDYSAFYGCDKLESVIIPKSVTKIVSYAFYRTLLSKVYYEGTAEEWNGVKVNKTGNDIAVAEVYYYSENKPAETGNYWHYASDGTPEKW